jgi:predicted DCC family thiol-disulfide oxidoreductase YuxK
MKAAEDWSRTTAIVYDGDCPFCSSYVKLLRLTAAVGRVDILNAREGGVLVEDIRRRGLNLDDGMVLVLGGKIYHGVDCINRLALLSTPSGVFSRVVAKVFRSRTASKALYPLLRIGRNVALAVLGRSKISVREDERTREKRCDE